MTKVGSAEKGSPLSEEGGEREEPLGKSTGFFAKLKRIWNHILVTAYAMKFVLRNWFSKRRKLDFGELEENMGANVNLVITGGNGGIGAEVVKQCLQQNMNVIIGCRNLTTAESLLKRLRSEGITSGSVEYCSLDLNSFESVKQFAQFVLSKNIPIHVLINNAAIMLSPFELTEDGFEAQFQTNYLSHFFLTLLLQPALEMGGKASAPSRVVNVSSAVYLGGRVDFDNIDNRYNYSPEVAYMNSKMMMVIGGHALNRRFKEAGMHIVVYNLHPGVIRTGLFKHVGWVQIFGPLLNFLFETPEQGADGIVFVAFSPTLKGEGAEAKFYSNCTPYPPHPLALDEKLQDKLYQFSVERCGFNKIQAWSPVT